MTLPTMEELRTACENGAIVEWHLDTAYYHGFMAALDMVTEQMGKSYVNIYELRDMANADMAATIGG